MKSLWVMAACLLAVFDVHADKLSENVVDRMSRTLTAKGEYKMTFSVKADDMDAVKGEVSVMGEKYRISVAGQVQFSDSKYRYEINPADRQVIIDNIDLSSTDILSNPIKAFEFSSSVFDMSYGGIATVQGKRCETVLLTPKNDDLGNVSSIRLYVDRTTSLPVSLSYDFNGSKLIFSIDRISFDTAFSGNEFIYRKADYAGYEIMDFR